MIYRDMECPQCGRHRVESDGVCEKCEWDTDNGDFAMVTRPEDYIGGLRVGGEKAARIRRLEEEQDASWERALGRKD